LVQSLAKKVRLGTPRLAIFTDLVGYGINIQICSNLYIAVSPQLSSIIIR